MGVEEIMDEIHDELLSVEELEDLKSQIQDIIDARETDEDMEE